MPCPCNDFSMLRRVRNCRRYYYYYYLQGKELGLHWTVSWCLEVCSCSCVIQATVYCRPFLLTATASSSTVSHMTNITEHSLPATVLCLDYHMGRHGTLRPAVAQCTLSQLSTTNYSSLLSNKNKLITTKETLTWFHSLTRAARSLGR